ncbi:MAG: hypothetical protein ACOYWZ_10430 [Bacillota bacterium]
MRRTVLYIIICIFVGLSVGCSYFEKPVNSIDPMKMREKQFEDDEHIRIYTIGNVGLPSYFNNKFIVEEIEKDKLNSIKVVKDYCNILFIDLETSKALLEDKGKYDLLRSVFHDQLVVFFAVEDNLKYENLFMDLTAKPGAGTSHVLDNSLPVGKIYPKDNNQLPLLQTPNNTNGETIYLWASKEHTNFDAYVVGKSKISFNESKDEFFRRLVYVAWSWIKFGFN